MADGNGAFRLAAAGDLHCRKDQHGRYREMLKAVNGEAEGLVLAGDLTAHGTQSKNIEVMVRNGDFAQLPVFAAGHKKDVEALGQNSSPLLLLF